MKKIASIRRRVLVAFIFFIALFVVAPAIILSSLGYRFDQDKKIFVYSGSIVLKTTPSNVNITLDKKDVPQKKLDIINRSININGLTPKNYTVQVSADGYSTWKKDAEVHSGIATEFWNVVLVPNQIERKALIENNIVDYAFSPNKKKIAYFIEKDGWLSVFVRNEEEEIFVYHEQVNQQQVSSEGELKWSPDGENLLFSYKKDDGKEEVFFTGSELGYSKVIPVSTVWDNSLNQKPQSTSVQGKKADLNKNTNDSQKAIEINYSWGSQNNIYFILNGSLFVQPVSDLILWWQNIQTDDNNNSNLNNNANLAANKNNSNDNLTLSENFLPTKIKDNSNSFTLCGGLFCAVNLKDRAVDFFDDSGSVKSAIPFPQNYDMTSNYKLFAYGDNRLAILDGNDNLFLWDKDSGLKENENSFKFLFSGVKEVYFSDDGKKLLFSTKNEVGIYYVREWEVQPKHSLGDMEIIWRQPDELQKVQWYIDYQHVFVINHNEIKLIELDTRGGKNVNTFITAPNILHAGYDTGEKKLWYLEGDNAAPDAPKKLQEIIYPVSTGILSSFTGGQSS